MNTVLFFLIAAALLAANLLCGGFRIGYAIPAYCLLAVAACLSVFRLRSTPLGWPSRLCLFATTICFGYILARAELSPYPHLARFHICLALGALITYFLSAIYLTDGRFRAILVALLLLVGMVNAGVGAIQFFKVNDFMPFPLVPRSEVYGARASGFFLSPNNLAGYLEICLLMGIAMVWWGRWSIYGKVMAGYACAVCLGGIILTGSRGGYVSTAFGLFVLICISAFASIHRLRDRGWLVLLAVGCVLLAGGWGVKQSLEGSYLLQSRAASMVFQEKDTRAALWRAAVKQFSLSPITGTGSGTYLYYGRQFRADFVQTDPMVAHNDYLQLLAEYGIIGLVGIGLFLLEHLRAGLGWLRRTIANGSRTADAQSNSLALTIGAVSAVSAYIVHSVLDFNLQIPANALVMAGLFGFLAVPAVRPARNESVPGGVWMERIWGVLVLVLGLLLAITIVPRVPVELAREKARILDARWASPDTDVEIEDYVRKGLQADPNDADLLSQLGKTLLAQAQIAEDVATRQKLLDDAIQAYRRASELVPQDVVYVVGLAQSLDTAERFAESEPLFARALALDPNSGWVHWAYGVHFHLQGNLEKAEAEFKTSMDLFFPPGTKGYERVLRERQAAGKR